MADGVVYINAEEGIKRVMNNAKLYVKLLVKFRDTTKLEELENYITDGEFEKAQAEAHTIKGVAANLSLTELFKQSLELETQIKGKSVTPEQTEKVKNVFAQTLQEAEKVIAQHG